MSRLVHFEAAQRLEISPALRRVWHVGYNQSITAIARELSTAAR
jgi:hypothetical protein